MFDRNEEHALSKVISTQLSLNGKTERGAKIVHSFVTLEEVLLTTAFKEAVYYGGSTGEATLQKGSDMDVMIVAPDILVTENANYRCSEDKFGHVFLMVRDKSSPVYVKLKPLKLDEEDPDINIILDKSAGGDTLASSEKYVNYVVERHVKLHGNEHFQNGPCASFVSKSNIGHWTWEIDFAYAFKCTSWPNDTEEWFARPRQNGWPSGEILEKIRKLDCHVVATGNPLSPSRNVEWRISFMLAERELVRSFNEMQLKCFSLLKTILHSKISPSFPDHLSSYHMKTTLFWVIEEMPQKDWTPENLVNCVNICLDRISKSVRSKNLPHYILRKENLFEHKLMDSTMRMNLHEELCKYVQNPILAIFRYAIMGELGDILEQHGKEVLLKICSQSMDDLNVEESVKEEQRQSTVFFSFNIFQSILHLPLDEVLSLELSKNKDLDEELKMRVQLFQQLKTGLEEQRLAIETTNGELQTRHQDQAVDAFQCGCQVDALTGQLYLANYQIMMGNYQAAKTTLIGMLSQDVGVVYFGECSEYKYISIKPVMRVAIQKAVPSNLENQSKSGCSDVLFRLVDIKSVPYALQLECALSDHNTSFSIHPLVCAYFLFVVVYHYLGLAKEREKATNDLEQKVKITQGGVGGHRAFNLLAHAHLLGGNKDKALKSLIQSATLYPNPKNAALYIIAMLMIQNLNDGEVIYSRTN